MKYSIVLDTNVLISGLLSKNKDSPTVWIVNQIFNGNICLFLNEKILEEYIIVANRPKFGLPVEKIQYILKYIFDNSFFVEVESNRVVMVDEKDRPFYDVATTYGLFLVTGNMKHFPKNEKTVSPREFVDLCKKQF